MSKFRESMIMTGQPEYEKYFWNSMRGDNAAYDKLDMGRMANIGTYLFPTAASKKCMSELEKKSIFRQIATTIHAYGTDYKLMGTDTKDVATWVPEGGEIPMYNGMENFTKYNVGLYKAVAFVKLDEDFVDDAAFDMENYLLKRFAKNLGRIEDWAFVNGKVFRCPQVS